jgi:hypothetical protein
MYTHLYLSQCLQGIIGYICGSEGLDSSGLSSSAAVSSNSPYLFFLKKQPILILLVIVSIMLGVVVEPSTSLSLYSLTFP